VTDSKVGNLLPGTQIQQTDSHQVVAAAQVKALDSRLGTQLTRSWRLFAKAEDLDFPDAPAHQGGKESGVGSTEVELGLAALPD
jgi:hypothetical protein